MGITVYVLCSVPVLSGKGVAPSGLKVTALSNGLQVASVDNGGSVAGLAVYIKAGSRYETVPGTAHMLECLAFHSTQKRSTLKVQRDSEELGSRLYARASTYRARIIVRIM